MLSIPCHFFKAEPQNNLFESKNTSLENSFIASSHITAVFTAVIPNFFLEFRAYRRCNLTIGTIDRKPHNLYRYAVFLKLLNIYNLFFKMI